MPDTRKLKPFTNLCPTCANQHYDGPCYALRDSNSDCECECDSSISELEGMTAEQVRKIKKRKARLNLP